MASDLRFLVKEASTSQLARLARVLGLLEQQGLPKPSLQMLADGGINMQFSGLQGEDVLNVYVDRDGISCDYNSLEGANLHCEHRDFLDDDSVITYITSKHLEP
jgi:hypothetical protein